jgi:hypothetical protein
MGFNTALQITPHFALHLHGLRERRVTYGRYRGYLAAFLIPSRSLYTKLTLPKLGTLK